MRRIYWVCALCTILLATFLMARQAESRAPKKIAYEELVRLLDKPRDVLFIDVREPNEIAVTGTLKGALIIPIGQLEQRLKEVPKDKRIVPFCRLGGRATTAANLLNQKGYTTVGVFGMEDYHEKLKNYIVYPK